MINPQLFTEQLETLNQAYQLHVIRIDCPTLNPLLWLDQQSDAHKRFFASRDGRFQTAAIGVSLSIPIDASKPDSLAFGAQRIDPKSTGFIQLPFDTTHHHESSAADQQSKLVFPRLQYSERTHGAEWKLYITEHELNDGLKTIQSILDPIVWTGSKQDTNALEINQTSVSPDYDQWCQMVSNAQHDIQDNHLEKVVLARELTLHCKDTVRPCQLLSAAIDTKGPLYYGLVQDRPDDAFIFQSPERLVQINQSTVSTEALAGSIKRGDVKESDLKHESSLLRSSKNRWEHSLVLKHIESILAHHCSSVQSSTDRHILKLPYIQHILQPVQAQLKSNTQWATLLDRLHPTPAVCGFDQKTAQQFIKTTNPLLEVSMPERLGS